MTKYEHINVARKLQDQALKRVYIEQEIQGGGPFKYLGLVNRNVGPPKALTEQERKCWDKKLMECSRECVADILLPSLITKLNEGKRIFTKIIRDKLLTEREETVRDQVIKGFGRSQKKWRKRHLENNIELPQYLDRLNTVEAEEIGVLKRGEVWTAVDNGFIHDFKISKSKDVFKIVAHSIHGSGRLRNILHRNIWKFINADASNEERNFTPHIGILNNDTKKWIGNWRTFCSLLQNRDLCYSVYELEIVSKLYDVNIRVFKCINGVNFDCMWQTSRNCRRVVNLLVSPEDEWSLLLGREARIGDEGGCDRIDRFSIITESEFSEVSSQDSTAEIEHMRHEVDRYSEVDGSIISTDSESRKELTEIKDKLIGSLSVIKKNKTSKDIEQCTLEELEEGNRFKTNGVLGWSVITVDSNSQKELTEIENKLNYIEKMNIVDLDNSMSTISTESDSIVDEEEVVVNSSRADEKIGSLEAEVRSFLELDNNEVSSISPLDKSDKSKSSMDEEFRWLFEEKEQRSKDRSDYDSSSMTDSVDDVERMIRRDSLNGSKKNHRQIKDRETRKRKFWRKWKAKIRNVNRNKTKKHDKHILKEGIQQKSTEAVFDYSSKGLDRAEIELLSKGSTFCIANNKVKEDRFKADIYAYSRRLRLHEEFRDQSFLQGCTQRSEEQRDSVDSNIDNQDSREHTQISHKKEKPKGRKLPSAYDPDSQNRNLARYCNCIQEESLLAVKTKSKFRDNISREHRIALNTLRKKIEHREIVITLADKGSGIVVLDYDTYISKGTKYIEVEAKAYSESTKSHKQIVTDIVNQRNKIAKKLREHEVIEVDTATYCMKQPEEKITGMKFYYKVHKDTNIDTMPLRPLQSCIGSPTHHLSQVMTDLLQPYLSSEYIPTFIQDSNQLLYRLSKIDRLDTNSTLISSDVAALYPSIPHKEGLEAVSKFLLHWSDYSNIQIKYMMLALELVITQNFVMWNGKIYSQDSGVAMGTPVAVAYANIFMDWIDEQLRQRVTYIVEHIRYIDDNLFIIPEDKIDDLMTIANSILVPHIRFTYDKLDKSADIGLPFLDTQLFISSKLVIESRLYTKKTDKHTYLLPTSFHPSHITRNIPLAVFNRIRRICSKYEWFQADAMLAIQWLEDRGYNYRDIKIAVDKSSKKDRWEMIEKIEANRVSKLNRVEVKSKTIFEVPIIVTYNNNAGRLKEVLKKRQTLLDASFNQTQVRPRLSFRRQSNINDILIQKGLRKPIVGSQTEECILELCGIKPRNRIPCPCKGNHDQQMCRCCAHLKLKLGNIKIRLHKKVNCESKNLIYLLGCRICQKVYVGETQQQLKDRFLQHLNNVTKLSQPLYTHFRQVHKAENMYISVLESVRSNDHTFRKIREAWWINELQSLEPRGFNIKLECSQVYQASTDTINIERRRNSKRI